MRFPYQLLVFMQVTHCIASCVNSVLLSSRLLVLCTRSVHEKGELHYECMFFVPFHTEILTCIDCMGQSLNVLDELKVEIESTPRWPGVMTTLNGMN